ncbi:EAL domain-containing protein [Shewanella avicenniae]|uniref:EAL domain-containing protein n=1 Tax=Shewanella avicenniae TaxID=2814294 RepID=A0ABX7QKU2_9GAMM|nr:EAL domain-containing protein [Shewanella avicenniae]QSX32073.1 EAL domain-containing protein [Shewanella avicenniae]
MKDELFEFAQEAEIVKSELIADTWKVLSVEDNAHYQASLVNSLHGYCVKGRPIKMLTAANAIDAAEIIASTPDLAVALLDVVMEDDEAGLRLVNTIRNVLGNTALRVILLTGQPGMAPFVDVMQHYDIDEYWQKTEISVDKIRSIVSANLRTWHAYYALETARKSLSMVVEASKELSRLRDVTSYSNVLLQKVAEIIDASAGGIICALDDVDDGAGVYKVISRSGRFADILQQQVNTLDDIPVNYLAGLTELIKQCQLQRQHQFSNHLSVLYFATDKAERISHFIMVVESEKPLSDYHINLLKVFSENVSNGFNNILLCDRLTELAYYDNELKLPNRAWLLRFIDSLTAKERNDAVLVTFTISDYHELLLGISSEYICLILKQFIAQISALSGKDCYIARMKLDCFTVVLHREDLQHQQSLAALSHLKLIVDNIQLHLDVIVTVMDLSLVDKVDAREVFHLLSSTIQRGRNAGKQFIEYSAQFGLEAVNRHRLLQGLNEAIEHNHLFLMYQPKVRLHDRAVVGLEALVRWRTASGEFISPAEFIPVAEMSGLIKKVDLRVFEMSLVALQTLKHLGLAVPLSFNVTVSDLEDEVFTHALQRLVDSNSELKQLLEIELTESQAMADYQQISPLLKQLIDAGIGVNIDDFGTGYSSLKHLTDLTATHLKIDRSFVDSMLTDCAGEHVVDVIIRLGKRFNFTVVAEGVETEAQQQKLMQLGCDIGQGYLFAKPMVLDDLIIWLKNNNIA